MRKSITRALLGGLGAAIITLCMTVASWSMSHLDHSAGDSGVLASGPVLMEE